MIHLDLSNVPAIPGDIIDLVVDMDDELAAIPGLIEDEDWTVRELALTGVVAQMQALRDAAQQSDDVHDQDDQE